MKVLPFSLYCWPHDFPSGFREFLIQSSILIWRLQTSVTFLLSLSNHSFSVIFGFIPRICSNAFFTTSLQVSHLVSVKHHKILWRLQALLTTGQYSCPYSGFPKDSVLCLCLICFISFCSVLGCSKSSSYNTESSLAASSPSLSTFLGVTSTSWIN